MAVDEEMKMEGGVDGGGEEGSGEGDVFEEHLRHFRNSRIASHKHLCAVISAMGEVIKEQGLKPTATAYFAAVMSSMENKAAREDESVMAAMCSLLAMVMPMVRATVLRSKMAATIAVVTELITSMRESAPAISKTCLSCLGHLLAVADRTQWDSLSRPYDLLLQHCVHSRPKVRKKAQNCVVTILTGLRGSAAHGAASEAIVSLSERLFADAMAVPKPQGGKEDGDDGNTKKGAAANAAQAAAEALHLLGAMKQLLPLMSGKAIGRASHRLAQLCSLQQPMLTRLVANAIQSLSDEGVAESELSADVLAETVVKILELEEEGRVGRRRDPDVVMSIIEMTKSMFLRLHRLDRAVCSRKLPQVFNLLAGNMASEQEEVIFRVADCLKVLIGNCIDDTMIKEGHMQVGLVAERRRGGLTPIERLTVMVESLLGYQYASAWQTMLLVVAAFLEKLGPASAILATNVVKTLGELQELPDENMPCRQQLHTAIGTAVAAMGPEQLLKILPFEMDNQDLSQSRAWLLPIMKKHVVGARLQFFVEYFLPLSARLRERGRKCGAEGRPVAAKNSEACILQIWSLLPALCNYPTDTARSFRLVAKALGDALLKEPELRGCICTSLQILIEQNKKARGDPGIGKEDAEEEKELGSDGKLLTAAEERARAACTPEVASANLAAIGGFARNFLPLLFNIFISLEPEKRAFLQKTIDGFASVADPATIKGFFMSVMEKLVEALKEAASAKTAEGESEMQVDGDNKAEIVTTRRCTFMELALSLVQGLDEESLHVLYKTARVGILDSDFTVQKKSYKLLAKIYELKGEFMGSHTQDMLEGLLASLGVCHSTARKGRLVCVQHVIVDLIKRKDPQASDALVTLLSEVILATKENNAKTRITAFDIILNIGRSMEEAGGPDQGTENLQRFFTMVVAGLAGTTQRMVSCSVMALARLLYEFSMRLSHMVPQLLPTVLLLLRSKNREIVKAVLGFVKVVVMRLPGTELEPHLEAMVQGLTVWSDDTKSRFKGKVRLIFEMLLRRCGYDAIAAVMPEEHMKLLTNIRKSKERAERHRKEGRSVAGDGAPSMKSRATTTRKSGWKHDDVFSDDADDEDEARPRSVYPSAKSGPGTYRGGPGTTASTRKMRQTNSRLPADVDDSDEDNPLDLLDASRARKALMSGSRGSQKELEEQDDIKYAPDGRMVIDEREDRKEKKRKRGGENDASGSEDDEERGDTASRGGKSSSKWEKKSTKSGKDLIGKHAKKKRSHTGEEYKPKKGAGGDTKGTKKLEPYAYWPLDRKLLNRREGKRAIARKGMAGAIKVRKGKTGMLKRHARSRK